MLLISNKNRDLFLSGNLTTGYFWTSNKEAAFVFKSESEAVDFEDGPARDFVSNELTDLLDYKTLASIF